MVFQCYDSDFQGLTVSSSPQDLDAKGGIEPAGGKVDQHEWATW